MLLTILLLILSLIIISRTIYLEFEAFHFHSESWITPCWKKDLQVTLKGFGPSLISGIVWGSVVWLILSGKFFILFPVIFTYTACSWIISITLSKKTMKDLRYKPMSLIINRRSSIKQLKRFELKTWFCQLTPILFVYFLFVV